jgi:hypothetical protein
MGAGSAAFKLGLPERGMVSTVASRPKRDQGVAPACSRCALETSATAERRAICVGARNYGTLDSGSYWKAGRRVWVLGMLEGNLRSFMVGVFLNCSKVTCPNPSLIMYWGFGILPRHPNPAAHPTRCGGGEQIPQLSVIMLLISGNVHGATLKPSELI